MNVTQLLARTRQILAEQPQTPGVPKAWEELEILGCLNSAYDSLWNRATLADEYWGLSAMMLSELGAIVSEIPGNLVTVTLPQELGTIVLIEQNVRADSSGEEVVSTHLLDRYQFLGLEYPVFESRRGWFSGPSQANLYFTKIADALQPATTRIWFLRKAPHLIRFKTSVYNGTTALDLNINTGATLGSLKIPHQYYTNSWMECITAPASGFPQKLTFQVVNWQITTYPTYRMTFGGPIGALVGESVWESLPLFPEQFHELICQLGAKRAMTKGADQRHLVIIDATVAELMDEFINVIEQRQLQHPRGVIMEG